MTRNMLILCLSALLLISSCKDQPAATGSALSGLDEFFERDELTIIARDGSFESFDVYLATNFEQHRRGLMFVRELPEKTGMLFVYDGEAKRSMWMKNTYIPLDIAFARSDGSISSVIHDTEPLSLESLASTEPVAFVLELNAGVARRYKIGPGSRLDWSGNSN